MAQWDSKVGAATLRIIINLAEQDTAGNRSRVNWELQLLCTNGISRNLNGVSYSISGHASQSGSFTFDFRSTSSVRIGTGTAWVAHRADGTSPGATISGWIANTATSAIGGPGSVSGTLPLPAISRVPPAPTVLGTDQITSRSFRHRFQNNGTGGMPILRWETQYATNPAFTGAITVVNGGTVTITGLTPGADYWIRDRGVNALGNGAWSQTATAQTLLDAPVLTSWKQQGGQLVAAWSAPDPATGLKGYRVQIGADSQFLTIVQTITAAGTSEAISGLPGGRTYYARVAAYTDKTQSAWSEPLPGVLLVLASGDIDRWSRFGARPAALIYYTAEGIRRGVLGTRQALWLESYSTGPVTIEDGAIGIQRTIPTVPGRAYTVRLTLTTGAEALAHTYRLEAPGETGEPVTATATGAELGPLVFVAAGSSSLIRVALAERLTVAAATTPVEHVAVTAITVTEAAGDYAQRLRSTVYESNLAAHFDLACNSVGASWYADVRNVTQFSLPGNALPTSAVFSDQATDGALLYTDIDVGYDTRSMVNVLDATNHGIGDDGLADDDTLAVTNPQSVSLYGPRRESLDVNLYTQPPYDAAFNSRLAEVLDAGDQPELLIRSVTWNAQQDIDAAHGLELAQRVLVEFNGTTQDSQLIGLEHTITPTRWMVTARFTKL